MADVKNLNVAGNVLVSNDVTISGNLDVLGTTTTITSSTVAITDKDLVLAKDNTTDASADGAGIIIKAGTDKTFLYEYNGGSDRFASSIALDVTGAITGATVATTGTITATGGFVGDGSAITNITAAGINAPGNNTELVFNNNGPFGSDANLTYDPNTNTLATAILTLSTPLAVASGGTGAGTELGARNSLQLGTTDNVTFANINGTDITASGNISGAGITASANADLQNGLTVTGGNSTFTNDVTINGNLTATGSLAFTDDIFQVGTGSSNTSAIGIRADKGTGSRHGYFTWSKANSRWDAYYSDQANGGVPFVRTSINAELIGDVTGTVSDISNHDTDALSEGSTNLYYTDERVDDRINSLVQAGTNVSVVYDDAANTFTINATPSGSGYDLSANTTSDLPEGTNLYYTSARFDTRLGTKTTDDLTEGSNLYYTTTRANTDFDTRLATKSTSDLAEGTNLYYTDARVDTYINSSITTDDVSEGANLYYTDTRARAVSIENVVEDSTPELGGNLDLNGNNINGTGNVDIDGHIKLGVIGSMSGTGGEIRWTGSDFVGYTGSSWESLTATTINQNTTQVANFTNSQPVTSTTYTDIAGYNTTITSTQSNSKIRVSVNLTFQSSNGTTIKLVRTVGASDTDITEFVYGSGDGNLTTTFVDSPLQSSGTAISYKLQAKVGSGTTTFNNTNTTNQISLEEVAVNPVAVTSVNGQAGVVSLSLDDIADVDTTSVADGAGLIKDGSDYVATTNNTGAMIMPVGTTAQRPGSPVQGMIRFNSDTSKFEGYDGTDWINLVSEIWGDLT